MAAMVNNEMKNMEYMVKEGDVIEWVHKDSHDGYRISSRTITLIFLLAAKRVIPHRNIIIEHSIGNGLCWKQKTGKALRHEETFM